MPTAPAPETTPAPAAPPPRMKLSGLIYGLSKAGKSLMGVSTAPPRLLLDCENAAIHLPIRPWPDGRPDSVWDPRMPFPAWDKAWDTLVVRIRTWEDAITVLRKLQRETHPIRAVTVDSISELQWKLIESVAGESQPEIQQWGVIYRKMGTFCRQLRDLTDHPTNRIDAVIVNATARLVEVNKKQIMMPFLQGQMKDQIPYLFDVIGYLEKSEEFVKGRADTVTVRTLYTREQLPKRFLAGERVNNTLDPAFVIPEVTGSNITEIRKANYTFRAMQKQVWERRNSVGPVASQPIPAAEPPIPAEAETSKESA